MDWHRLARSLALGDGVISEREALILRREMLADRVVDRPEVEFLLELKRSAKAVAPAFDQLFRQVVKKVVLRDGAVGDAEALWLRRLLFTDNKVSAEEARLLEELKAEARSVGREFEALCRDCARSPDVVKR
jgi:hypothetical protein